MQKTINKITNNYINDIKNAMEYLKTKGFILNENKEIYKFNIFEKTFNFISFNDFKIYVFENMENKNNIWNFTPETQSQFITNLLKENNIFPEIETSIIKQFELYNISKQYLSNENNLFSKRELNKVIKENNEKKTNDNIIFDLYNIEIQSQILINNNVFIDPLYKLWKYEPEQSIFYRYYDNDIKQLFNQYIDNTNNKTLKNQSRNQLLNTIIKENKAYYLKYLTYVNALKWNKQQENENNLIKYKSSYKAIKKIITNFK